MWLRFVSDSSITLQGFKVVYRFERQKSKYLAPAHKIDTINIFNLTPFALCCLKLALSAPVGCGMVKNG